MPITFSMPIIAFASISAIRALIPVNQSSGSGDILLNAIAAAVPSPTTSILHDLARSGPEDGWAVGKNGVTLRLSATGWEVVPSPTVVSLRGVTVDGTTAWAVGDGGVILRLVGNEWQMVSSPTGIGLLGVAAAGGEAWAVGLNGTPLHYPTP